MDNKCFPLLALLLPLALISDASASSQSLHGPENDTLALPPIHARARTSPFAPPEENDTNFVTDDGPKLDTGCLFRSSGPIEFDVMVDRYVGNVNFDGNLVSPELMVDLGVVSPTATLIIPAFDVDTAGGSSTRAPEQDRVLFNGKEVGFLSGSNNTWKLNTFEVDISEVKFPDRGAIIIGSGYQRPTPVANHVTIEIDVANETEEWCTSVDWGAMTFGATSPVLLIHGNNSSPEFFDNQGFVSKLNAFQIPNDWSIDLGKPNRVVANAAILNARIPSIVRSFGVDSVHFVTHSKGGLDLKYYLARYQPRHEADFTVLSYNTLSTPHNGSASADILVTRERALRRAASVEFVGFPGFIGFATSVISADRGTRNLTTTFAARLNAVTLPLIDEKIIFNTVAADADRNGNGEIDRDSPDDEYEQIRLESPDLGTLDLVPGASKKVVNFMYRVLGGTASVGVEFYRLQGARRVHAILRQRPTPGHVGNDLLVTIPSGQGVGGVQARTSNTRVMQGSNGRNHADVADHGVAESVVRWILAAERLHGDL